MSIEADQRSYQEVEQENIQLHAEIVYLKQELAQLKRFIFGQSRERFIGSDSSSQLELDLGDEKQTVQAESETISYTRKKKSLKQTTHGRNPLPDHLPRHDHIIEPDEDTSSMQKIGEEITEELDYKPGSLYVNRYIRPKYALPVRRPYGSDDQGVVMAALPSRPIEKGIPGPGLLAHVAISKFLDHQPLYRQKQQFKRQGVDISDSTLGDWIKAGHELLTPVYERHKQYLLKSDYLMADETPIKVLDRGKKGKSHRGYFWVYYDPLGKAVLFDYRPGRGREGPHEILSGFKGHLQVDGYKGYDKLGQKTEITLLGCMAHARRYFEQALSNDKKRAEWILDKIRLLYMIERFAKNHHLSFEERLALRRENGRLILTEIKAWLDREQMEVLPKSLMGKAIGYMQTLWDRLERYVDDGRFEIDNNLVENAIRPVALGRKNYLFAGSHNGAKRAALYYTLISTTKQHGHDPYEYLRKVMSCIADHPYKKLDELLPVNWAKSS